MPTLVHGVDISALEGWMVKINNNPSVFGKSVSRRWFRVSFVPAGNDQKLIISYSSSKTSKEPRGWLFIEDVSGVYCRRDMIEVVSPARTLRFKGETAVEHRLWSDSLHKLCNPPKEKTAEQLEDERRAEAEEERRRERLRQQDRDRIADPKKTKEYVASRHETKREPSPEKHARKRDDKRSRRRRARDDEEDDEEEEEEEESDDDSGRDRQQQQQENDRDREEEEEEEEAPRDRRASPRRQSLGTTARMEESEQRAEVSRRHSAGATASASAPTNGESRVVERELPTRQAPASRRRNDSHSDSDSDSDSDREEKRSSGSSSTKARVATLDRRPSQLVASIKSMTPISVPAERKAPSRTSSLASMSKATAAEDRGSLAEPSIQRRESLSKNEEDRPSARREEPQEPESKPSPARESPKKAAIAASAIRADNNFVEDDWDADDAASAPPPKATASAVDKAPTFRHGGVAADSNFATDDWDD